MGMNFTSVLMTNPQPLRYGLSLDTHSSKRLLSHSTVGSSILLTWGGPARDHRGGEGRERSVSQKNIHVASVWRQKTKAEGSTRSKAHTRSQINHKHTTIGPFSQSKNKLINSLNHSLKLLTCQNIPCFAKPRHSTPPQGN